MEVLNEVFGSYIDNKFQDDLHNNNFWMKKSDAYLNLFSELKDKLNLIDSDLVEAIKDLEDARSCLECEEYEIIFKEGFKMGMKLMLECLK